MMDKEVKLYIFNISNIELMYDIKTSFLFAMIIGLE